MGVNELDMTLLVDLLFERDEFLLSLTGCSSFSLTLCEVRNMPGSEFLVPLNGSLAEA